jgi:DNA-binding transcriptional ArsR family regulator
MTTPVLAAPFSLSVHPTEGELLAKYFRVLSDRARLRILEALSAADEPNVSNHLACLRWCGFVETRREHRTVYNRIADPRVVELIELGRALLAANAEHVAACERA